MAKIEMVATKDFKAHKAGDTIRTSLKNSRDLIAQGVAALPGQVPAKKFAAKKAPAKAAAKKAPAKKSTYRTRALKAAK